MPVFKKIATGFFFGPYTYLNEFSGAVIAESRGFYFVFNRVQFGQWLARLQGASGYSSLLMHDELSENNDALVQCDLADLPVEIAGHPDWPVKLTEGRMIFIPKQVIDSISYSIWKGVTVKVGESQYHFAVGLFKGRSVIRFLRDVGWDI